MSPLDTQIREGAVCWHGGKKGSKCKQFHPFHKATFNTRSVSVCGFPGWLCTSADVREEIRLSAGLWWGGHSGSGAQCSVTRVFSEFKVRTFSRAINWSSWVTFCRIMALCYGLLTSWCEKRVLSSLSDEQGSLFYLFLCVARWYFIIQIGL